MNKRGVWATHELGDHGFPDLVLAHLRAVLYSQNSKAIKARSHRFNHDGLQRFNKAPSYGYGDQRDPSQLHKSHDLHRRKVIG
jgi:hypothetical protein